MSTTKKKILVAGMRCSACESRLEQVLRNLPGILKVKASYAESTICIEYQSDQCTLAAITQTIAASGEYTAGQDFGLVGRLKNATGILVIFLAILLLGEYTGGIAMDARMQTEGTYSVLFLAGLLTSLHCAGMCGGILFSQTVAAEGSGAVPPALAYNGGRVLGYMAQGGLIGAIGSVLSVSSGFMSGITIFAGLFMILRGLNMVGFKLFRKYLHIPWPKLSIPAKANAPFLTGLFNSLMPCGPLQTMQLYTLGTGSAWQGALAMLAFSLGTLPLMLFLGTMTSLFNKSLTKRILQLSGVLIIMLGLIMTTRGLAIAGVPVSLTDLIASKDGNSSMAAKAQLENGRQTIRMSANNNGYTPNVLYVQKGVPVTWVIDGEQINSCNNQLIIPALNLKRKLSAGVNTIEFTPQDQDLNFSCWMGMIRGAIKAVDDVNAVDVAQDKTIIASGSDCCSAAGMTGCCDSQAVSIYGDVSANVPTERLIRKAIVGHNQQAVMIKGIGSEFAPLIVLLTKQYPAKIQFDLTEFTNAEGIWRIADYQQKNPIHSFIGKQGVVDINYNTDSVGTFGIYKDNKLIGIIEVVDSLNTTDPEEVKAKFL